MFLSSHVLSEVELLADRVAILRRGRLVKIARVKDLRRSARQRVDLYFHDRVDAAPFTRIPEVVESRHADGVVHLVVEGSVERVLRTAARLHAYRIVSPEADLEDVFLEYYEDAPS